SILSVFASLILSIMAFRDVYMGNRIHYKIYDWIISGNFTIKIGFLIDELTAIMLIVVTSISTLVFIYSIGYMHGDKGYYRYYAYLNLFVFSMLTLVMADNFLLLYLGWEAVGLSSYLLIGFWFEKPSAANAGKKAFIVNRVGDFGFSLGIIMIFLTFSTLDYMDVFKMVESAKSINIFGHEMSSVTIICLLLFCGAMGKSAQFPLHVWLPDAMEGPTPVSALIHAATMVTAGVYLVARCNPMFGLSEFALSLVSIVGGFTAIFAATIALVQVDIKRIIAYSTLSQLGYMFLSLGVGAYTAAIFHLFTHAYFKALLFLGAGSIIHAMDNEMDIRKMGGLKRYMPITYWTFLIASLSISGIPGFAGFFSKDAILWSAYKHGTLGFILWMVGVFTALLTAFYSFRLFFMVFHGDFRQSEDLEKLPHESPLVMTIPLI
ncbi:MAG: NADH-quinone oxidoreductase subunit L, partial [Nitrospirae bacterium]